MEREKLKIELIKYENWVEEQNLKEYLKTTIEKTIDNYLSTLPDEKEDEINPYLLTGEELEKAVEKRKSNQP